jgi:subtilisin family serine protease
LIERKDSGANANEAQLERASVELLRELFGGTAQGTESDSAQIPAYIHFDSAAAARDFRSQRPECSLINAAATNRVRANADSDSLLALLSNPKVRAITLIERLLPSMNYAANACSVPEFKTNRKLSGNGVLIGMIDSGADASNPMLAGQIAAVWDQTYGGTPVGGVPFGRLLAPPNLGQVTDSVGHGTHVAGIAAGRDAVFGGIADGATLIIVKSNLNDADVEQTLPWLQSIATEMKRPMVVNLSMEGRNDPHDGSGSLCQAIDDLSGPGFIVCCASGNTGGELDHADATLEPGGSADFAYEVSHSANRRLLTIKGWADAGADLSLALTDPSGQRWDPDPLSGSGPRRFIRTTRLHGAIVDLTLPKREPAFDDATGFLVSMRSQMNQDISGIWTLHVRNAGTRSETVHLWSTPENDIHFRSDVATDRVKIGAPGAAQRAITVGAMVTRIAWLDDALRQRVLLQHQRFSVASFSSPGPLRTKSEKPDFVAPGAHICSARSAAAIVSPGYAVSQHHRIMAGSSMATPYIAGVVALMLEADPNLTPEDIKEQLRPCSSIPGVIKGAYDTHAGYGLPDLVLL